MDYVYFTFDNVSSSRYNLLIQNQGEDLIFPSQPAFENQIISPIYQGANYLAGVNKKDRIFNFNCWVDSISTEVVREMINWLSVNKIGTLVLDYNPNFQYRVKINSIGDFKHMALNEDGTNNYEFSLSFITIGNPSSESTITYKLDQTHLESSIVGPNYDNGGPIAFIDPEDNKFKFLNYYSEAIPLQLNIATLNSFNVSLNDKIYYEYSLEAGSERTNFEIDTEYGFCRVDEQLAESVENVNLITNEGLMKIPSGESQIMVSNLTYWDEGTEIIQINNSNNRVNYTREEISKGNLYIIIQDGSYGNESTPGLPEENSIIIWEEV